MLGLGQSLFVHLFIKYFAENTVPALEAPTSSMCIDPDHSSRYPSPEVYLLLQGSPRPL